eukprot:PhM_4_TR1377/c0_g1_i1/m.40148
MEFIESTPVSELRTDVSSLDVISLCDAVSGVLAFRVPRRMPFLRKRATRRATELFVGLSSSRMTRNVVLCRIALATGSALTSATSFPDRSRVCSRDGFHESMQPRIAVSPSTVILLQARHTVVRQGSCRKHVSAIQRIVLSVSSFPTNVRLVRADCHMSRSSHRPDMVRSAARGPMKPQLIAITSTVSPTPSRARSSVWDVKADMICSGSLLDVWKVVGLHSGGCCCCCCASTPEGPLVFPFSALLLFIFVLLLVSDAVVGWVGATTPSKRFVGASSSTLFLLLLLMLLLLSVGDDDDGTVSFAADDTIVVATTPGFAPQHPIFSQNLLKQ